MLIVVVVIGILAAVAIPKFAATRDKARLASVRADVHNTETAEEAYFSDFKRYGTFAQLQTANRLSLSAGNTMTITAATNGNTISATNNAIASAIKSCNVRVGAGAAATVDGKLTCP